MIKKVTASLILIAMAVASARCQTANYPSRPITIISPYAAGGLGTLLVHLMGPAMEQQLGQPVVAEAKPGAGSVIGSLAVIQSPADGYTLLINTTSGLTTHLAIKKVPNYNPQMDLVPVALLAKVPQVLVVNASLPIYSIADIAKLAKTANITFASSGIGTSQHLAGESLRSTLNVEMTYIPYRGSAPALDDVAGGHVSMMFSDVLNALPFVQSGKLRMIFVSGAERVAAIPNIPSTSELNISGFEEPTTFMILAPAKTPSQIVNRLNAEIRAVMKDQKISEWIKARGLIPIESPPPVHLRNFLQDQIIYWADAVRKAGLVASQ